MHVLPRCHCCGDSEVGVHEDHIVCCGCGVRWSLERVQAAFGGAFRSVTDSVLT